MWFCTPFQTYRGRNQKGHRRPEAECLEDRTLLTVHYTPGPYLTPANRPDVPLGVIGVSPIEPMLAVNTTEPGNIAVSSQNGIRITTNAGAAFGQPLFFKDPAGYPGIGGDTDLKFDGQGRLFWSNATASAAQTPTHRTRPELGLELICLIANTFFTTFEVPHTDRFVPAARYSAAAVWRKGYARDIIGVSF